jgi:hypothetical protein
MVMRERGEGVRGGEESVGESRSRTGLAVTCWRCERVWWGEGEGRR